MKEKRNRNEKKKVKELAKEACRKARKENENEEKEDYYCREAHGKERQEHFETETIDKKEIRL